MTHGAHGSDNSTTHVLIARKGAQVWDDNAEAWVTWDDADVADYSITTTRSGTSTFYSGTIPDDSTSAELWVTPIVLADGPVDVEAIRTAIGTGDGDTPVDHNYGGTDELRVTLSGSGVDNAQVRAYLTAEYDAGTFTVRGLTHTGSDGRFVAPLMLDPDDYTLVVSKAGVIQSKISEVTVA